MKTSIRLADPSHLTGYMEIIEAIHEDGRLRKCDHCGIYITDLEDMVEQDGQVFCSHACANAQQ